MPHTADGRIYVDRTVTPNLGIDVWADVGTVLGTGSGDIGTNCRAVKTSENGIGWTPWAKNRPYIDSSPVTLSDAQRRAINYGLVSPLSSTNPATAYSRKWGSGVPGSNKYCRISDFEGYFHQCKEPTRLASSTGAISYNLMFESDIAVLLPNTPLPSDTYQITYGSLGEIENWYLAIVYYYNGYYYIRTSSNNFGSGLGVTSMDILSGSDGDMRRMGALSDGASVRYYIMACDTRYTILTQLQGTENFMSLPYFFSPKLDGTVTISTANPFDVDFTTVSKYTLSQLSEGHNYLLDMLLQLSRFTTARVPATGDVTYYYFDVRDTTSYCLQLCCTLTNTTNSPVTIYKGLFSVEIPETFARMVQFQSLTVSLGSMHEVERRSVGSAYGYFAKAGVNELTIPAQSSMIVIFALPDYVLRMNASGTVVSDDSQLKQTYGRFFFNIKYNNVAFYTAAIRLRNVNQVINSN